MTFYLQSHITSTCLIAWWPLYKEVSELLRLSSTQSLIDGVKKYSKDGINKCDEIMNHTLND